MSDTIDQGILLRLIPYRETSCMLHVLTAQHGRISLLARGVRKQKSIIRAALAPLHILQLTWKKGKTDLGYLQDVRRLQALLSEPHHLDGLELNSLAYQLFPEHEPASMQSLVDAYAMLEQRHAGLLTATWYLLRQHGWLGELHHCWHCMKEDVNLFWSKAHCCCQSCGQGMPLSKGLCLSIESCMQDDNVRLSHMYKSSWLNMVQDVLLQHGLKAVNFTEV